MPKASRNPALKWVLVAIQAIVFLILTVWVARNYFAVLVAEKPTVHNLGLAQELAPKDSFYPHLQGRIFQYSLTDIQPREALEKLAMAARLNTFNPQAWLDLGVALELQGHVDQAEQCLRRADVLAPRQPQFQWAIGNFFLLHGNVDEAFQHFKMVLASDPQYNQVIYTTAWKASNDANQILQGLIPNSVYPEFSYLYFLLASQRYAEADRVWNRIASSPEKFEPQTANGYIGTLINLHRPEDAYRVWSVMRSKGIISPTYEETPQNLIENGDFEEKPLSLGFDWSLAQVNGVYTGLDQTTFHSPANSLLVQFPGKGNLDLSPAGQYVLVKPDTSYQFRAFMKTDGITTDSGPRIEIRDFYDPKALDVLTQNLVGTTPGWIPVTQNFRTGPKTTLLAVVLARRIPSQEFDNQIAGKVWVDDVSLTEGSTPR